MAKKLTIYAKPNMQADIAVANLKFIEPPKLSFKVEMEVDDKIAKEVEKDTVLLKDMNAAIDKIYQENVVKTIKSKINSYEKAMQEIASKGAKKADMEKMLKGLNTSMANDNKIAEIAATQAAEAVWKNYSKTKKEYTKYKIKIGAKIVGALASLVTSIALMATTPFTAGAGAAFGIIGAVKSAVTLAKEIGSAWMEIETAQIVLGKQLLMVESAAKSAGKRKVNEYTSTIINQFVGISQPCIKNCISQLDTVNSKLKGIEVKTHEAGKTLNTMLDHQKKLRTEFMKGVNEKLGKHPAPNAKEQIKLIEGRLDNYLASNYQLVQKQISKVEALHERFLLARNTTKALAERVAPLAKLRGLDEKIFENVLLFVSLPLAALSGNAPAKETQDLINGLVPAATDLAYEKLCGVVFDKTLLA